MCWQSAATWDHRFAKKFCFNVSLCRFYPNLLLRICSEYPDFNLAGRKLETPYVGRSLMRPLTPPPRSSTPPSLFPAAEAFEDVPDNLGTSIFSYWMRRVTLCCRNCSFWSFRRCSPGPWYVYVFLPDAMNSLFRRNGCISARPINLRELRKLLYMGWFQFHLWTGFIFEEDRLYATVWQV